MVAYDSAALTALGRQRTRIKNQLGEIEAKIKEQLIAGRAESVPEETLVREAQIARETVRNWTGVTKRARSRTEPATVGDQH